MNKSGHVAPKTLSLNIIKVDKDPDDNKFVEVKSIQIHKTDRWVACEIIVGLMAVTKYKKTSVEDSNNKVL